jgi:hypothetical protein
MDLLIAFTSFMLCIATVAVIYVLLVTLASKLPLLQKRVKQEREQENFSADSMKKCAESTINLTKSNYDIVCEKIIEDITFSIKERAKEGKKSTSIDIEECAFLYLRKYDRICTYRLARIFVDKHFSVIQKYFENRGFIVQKEELPDLGISIEISWE